MVATLRRIEILQGEELLDPSNFKVNVSRIAEGFGPYLQTIYDNAGKKIAVILDGQHTGVCISLWIPGGVNLDEKEGVFYCQFFKRSE